MMRTILAFVLIGVGATSSTAFAQLSTPGARTRPIAAPSSQGADVAYDSVHDVFLVVGDTEAAAFADRVTLKGVFVDALGNPLGNPFTIGEILASDFPGSRFIGHSASVVYSADLRNDAGGRGAFLVAWGDPTSVSAQVVAFPGQLVGSKVVIPNTTAANPTAQNAGLTQIAYSPAQQRFLLAWGHVGSIFRTRYVILDLDVRPITSVMPLNAETRSGACGFSNPSCNRPDVVFNPATGEFGVLFLEMDTGIAGPRLLRLARIRTDGTTTGVTSLTQLASDESRAHAVGVNPSTGSYITVWMNVPFPGWSVRAAEVDHGGNILASGVIASGSLSASGFIFEPARLMTMTYLPFSGTFVLLAHQLEGASGNVRAAELNQHGALLHDFVQLTTGPNGGGHAPRVAAGSTGWLAVFAGAGFTDEFWVVDGLRGIGALPIGTLTRGGGSAWRIGGCLPPDPFASLGGGTCSNGGWLPPGVPGTLPPPIIVVPPPNGCSTRDPFVSLGGGTCHNGGWLPPGMPIPGTPGPPPPVPLPTTCTTPDPFTSLGGGTCHNGGWLPPGMPIPRGGG